MDFNRSVLHHFTCLLQISETAYKLKSWRWCIALCTVLLTALRHVGSLVLSRQMPNKALLAELNWDKYVLIRLGNAAKLQSSLRIMHKVRRSFMWILRTETDNRNVVFESRRSWRFSWLWSGRSRPSRPPCWSRRGGTGS